MLSSNLRLRMPSGLLPCFRVKLCYDTVYSTDVCTNILWQAIHIQFYKILPMNPLA